MHDAPLISNYIKVVSSTPTYPSLDQGCGEAEKTSLSSTTSF